MDFTCTLLLISLVTVVCEGQNEVDRNEMEVSGPGLDPVNIPMPARYFFLYGRGMNYSGDLGLSENDFKVEVRGRSEDNRDCRLWVNFLNRRDSSFIIRYKLYEPCQDLVFNILYKGVHIKGSPFITKGLALPEDCYCPDADFDSWLERYGCGKEVPSQITSDLSQFGSVDFDHFYDLAVEKFNSSYSSSVCHFVVKNNQVHRSCYGEHVGFKMFMDSILLSLARKVRLPDMELFANLGDWPLIKQGAKVILPVFSWCGSEETMDIVMPTYDLTESSLEAMGRVSLDMLSVQGNIGRSWAEKEPKAFWRGRDASRERLRLIEISREHPDLFNTSLTNFFFFRDQEEKYGPRGKHVSFFKFFDYKYLLSLDGTVAAYRLPYLLAGDSLVIKQDSPYYEFFYRELRPWEHYVPITRELNNLVEVVKWARSNDPMARKISRAGAFYARSALLPHNVLCYHAILFQEWSKRLKNKISVRRGMEFVPQREQKGCLCTLPTPLKDEL